MKKPLIALVLAVFMLLGMATGCGNPSNTGSSGSGAATSGSASTGKAYKIGLSMPVRDQFQTSMEKAAVEKAKELGIDLKVFDANNDFSVQLGHVQTCAADGYDAVIVGLVNNDSAQEIINAAGKMKVVFVNRQPDLSVLKDGQVVYVGTDENLYGQDQGKFLVDYFKKEGKTSINAVLFQGTLGLDNVTKRTNSVKQALQDGGITVNYVYEDTAEWDRAKAMDKFTQFMGTGKPYDVVICNNDDMALGVIEAMKTTGEKKVTCPVVGIDATDVGCAAVKAGDMAATVYQDPLAQGGGTILCAKGLIEGTPIEGLEKNYYNITPQLVTIDNVDDFIKK